MPGPVSDSFDPEWGTTANAEEIREALQEVYDLVSEGPLAGKDPIYILTLMRHPRVGDEVECTLSEQQWRLIRFALERAMEFL